MAHAAASGDDAAMHRRTCVLVLAAALSAACANVRYDLGGVPFPVMASPAPAGAAGEAFEHKDKYILWGYGLFGEKQPDVAGALRGSGPAPAGVADFRVSASANLWDWLGTHLSLGLVRLRTVKVSGTRLAAPAK